MSEIRDAHVKRLMKCTFSHYLSFLWGVFSTGRTDLIQSVLCSPDPGGPPRYSQKIMSCLEKMLELLEVRKFTFCQKRL